jgi:hypothetical protein
MWRTSVSSGSVAFLPSAEMDDISAIAVLIHVVSGRRGYVVASSSRLRRITIQSSPQLMATPSLIGQIRQESQAFPQARHSQGVRTAIHRCWYLKGSLRLAEFPTTSTPSVPTSLRVELWYRLPYASRCWIRDCDRNVPCCKRGNGFTASVL